MDYIRNLCSRLVFSPPITCPRIQLIQIDSSAVYHRLFGLSLTARLVDVALHGANAPAVQLLKLRNFPWVVWTLPNHHVRVLQALNFLTFSSAVNAPTFLLRQPIRYRHFMRQEIPIRIMDAGCEILTEWTFLVGGVVDTGDRFMCRHCTRR